MRWLRVVSAQRWIASASNAAIAQQKDGRPESRGFAAPIRSLVGASKEVARGNLAHRVETIADDELALLAESFNQMTAELDTNRKQLEAGAQALKEKNLALEERRNYIETVLESLATGVVSLDRADCVTTINTAAISIL